MFMDEMITEAEFWELARTGRIGMDPEEAGSLRAELNRQMHVIRQLEAIPLDAAIRPAIHGNPYPEELRCGLREDRCLPFDNAAGIVGQAPVSRDGYIVSPDTAHLKIG